MIFNIESTYVPKLSEFHLGFEYWEKHEIVDAWKKKTFMIDTSLLSMRELIAQDRLRVDTDKAQDFKCKCSEGESTGETSVMCCNGCGLPVEDFWKGVKS